jgi:ATP-dependent DNA helicase RecG
VLRLITYTLVSNSITEQVTEQVLFLIQVMAVEYYAAVALKALVGIKHQPSFLYNYLQPALALGLIEMMKPDSPKSPKQKYRLM